MTLSEIRERAIAPALAIGTATAKIYTYANGYPGGDGYTIAGSISYRKQ